MGQSRVSIFIIFSVRNQHHSKEKMPFLQIRYSVYVFFLDWTMQWFSKSQFEMASFFRLKGSRSYMQNDLWIIFWKKWLKRKYIYWLYDWGTVSKDSSEVALWEYLLFRGVGCFKKRCWNGETADLVIKYMLHYHWIKIQMVTLHHFFSKWLFDIE